MQKLVWQNANGVELDLTSGNYGITEWEGFSNASLNIQQQQVPFQDGGVFLDALIEQRELSVTLAIQDNNNLELRYQQRRELISALNPKLGEGYLIYTNDYISKRIKCVPQIPLFETHNSDKAGTPKASLSWTACSPYWEDLEETVVELQNGKSKYINNEGEIPAQIKFDITTQEDTSIKIVNTTQNKMIDLQSETGGFFVIDTNIGEKRVTKENRVFEAITRTPINTTIYSSLYARFIVGGVGISQSYNGEDIEPLFAGTDLITCLCENNGVVVSGGNSGYIITTNDLKNFQETEQPVLDKINGIVYASGMQKYIVAGEKDEKGAVATSSDLITWTVKEFTELSNDTPINSIAYSPDLNRVVIGGGETRNAIRYYSNNGTEWVGGETGTSNDIENTIYLKGKGFVQSFAYNGYYEKSVDGITWESLTIPNATGGLAYSERQDKIVAFGSDIMLMSGDLENWQSYDISDVGNFSIFIDSKYFGECLFINNIQITKTFNYSEYQIIPFAYNLGAIDDIDKAGEIYAFVGEDGVYATKNFKTIETKSGIGFTKIRYVKQIEKWVGIFGSRIYLSEDLTQWTSVYLAPAQINDILISDIYGGIIAIDNAGNVIKTTDGVNYTSQNISNRLTKITEGEDKIIIIKSYSSRLEVYYSDDGENWENVLIDTNAFSFITITYSKQKNMYLLTNSTNTPAGDDYTYTSIDGVSWTRYTQIKRRIVDMIYSNYFNCFIGIGDKKIYTSVDGITIDTIQTTAMNVNAIKEFENKIFITGYTDYEGNTMGLLATVSSIGVQNCIANLNGNSDMTLGLEIGENIISITADKDISARMVYRQKYIGV